MRNITCPECGREETGQGSRLFDISKADTEVYQIRACSTCESIYTYFNHDVRLDAYYDEKDYTVRDTRKSIFFQIQKWEYSQVIRQIKQRTANPAPSILDFGSGKGLFMHFAHQLGCSVKGIESSRPRAEYAMKHFQLDVNTDYYSSGSVFDTKFDVLTLLHVLEHIDHPSELLGNLVQGNLKPGGLLVIEVPNFGSWQSKWAGSSWLHLDVPRHINHFTRPALKRTIEKKGFTIVREEYFSLHLGIIGMIQTIFSWFGYTGFLIAELKEKKSILLLSKILISLPFAVLLEGIASLFRKGGVIRFYAIFDQNKAVKTSHSA